MRSVKVGLEADVAKFNEPIDRAKAKLNDLDDKLDAVDRSLDKVAVESAKAGVGLKEVGEKAESAKVKVDGLKDKVEGLDRSLEKIPDDATKAAAAMALLKGDIAEAKASFDLIGDKASAFPLLDKRIANTRTEVQKLTKDFEKTGDVEIFKKLGKTQGDLAALEKLRVNLTQTIENGAGDALKNVGKLFSDGFSSMPPEAKLAIVNTLAAVILPAAAGLGAALNGVLLAGLGAGGIGLGIAGQINSPIVKAAFGQLGQDVKSQLTAATSGFEKPLASAAHIIDRALAGVLKDLGSDFDALAKHVEPLAHGIGALFAHAEPGFAKALEAAGPILDEIARDLPKLGDEIGRAFEILAEGGDGAKKGIDAIFLGIETLIVGVAGIVAGLSKLYDWITGPGEVVLKWFGYTADKTKEVKPAADEAFASISDGADNAAQHLKDLDTQFDTLVNNILGLDKSTIKIGNDFATLGDKLKGVGDKLDINTQRGRDNREVLDGLVGDLERQREAAIKAGGGTKEAMDKANAAFNDQLNKAEALADKLGIDKKAAHDYFAQFHDITFNITEVHTTVFDEVTGARKTGSSRLGGRDNKYGGVHHFASGGVVDEKDPGTFLMGEPGTGGEVFAPLKGISQNRAMYLAQTIGNAYNFSVQPNFAGGGGGGGSGPREIAVSLNFSGSTDTAMASAIMKMARTGELRFSATVIH